MSAVPQVAAAGRSAGEWRVAGQHAGDRRAAFGHHAAGRGRLSPPPTLDTIVVDRSGSAAPSAASCQHGKTFDDGHASPPATRGHRVAARVALASMGATPGDGGSTALPTASTRATPGHHGRRAEAHMSMWATPDDRDSTVLPTASTRATRERHVRAGNRP
jgi:hypothetical protein